ncbi:hypothetical protein F5Y09DRAFT_340855 [Xylaria sp. FL1042]|nr:hypothetical protein F5Y09DRAFT_340855 [Xylaria sp. FL1042]
MVTAALTLDGGDSSRAKPLDPRHLRLLAVRRQPLKLDRDTTLPYMKAFVDHEAVMAQEAVATTSEEGEVESALAHAYLCTYLGIAIGILHTPDAIALSSLVTRLHAAAVERLPFVLKPHDPLTTVQCLLTLAIFSDFHLCGGSTWHLTGLAMTQCISFGLHKEPDYDELDETTVRERRNIFWSVYMLDRQSSRSWRDCGKRKLVVDGGCYHPQPNTVQKDADLARVRLAVYTFDGVQAAECVLCGDNLVVIQISRQFRFDVPVRDGEGPIESRGAIPVHEIARPEHPVPQLILEKVQPRRP